MNNQLPKLKFALNRDLDIEMANNFFKVRVYGGFDFWKKGALSIHSDLENKGEALDEIFIADYIQKLYLQHIADFEIKKQEIENIYSKIGSNFLTTVDKIFNNYSWPEGEYICFLSVFDFCPRFLNNKTFQVFMYDSEESILFTIVHEMLHFQFYNYCQTKYKEIFEKLDTDAGYFWEMAEVFNAILQDTPEFIALHGKISNIGYPDHKDKINNPNLAWKNDIDKWVNVYLNKFPISFGQ